MRMISKIESITEGYLLYFLYKVIKKVYNLFHILNNNIDKPKVPWYLSNIFGVLSESLVGEPCRNLV